jgi:hypothetical protein
VAQEAGLLDVPNAIDPNSTEAYKMVKQQLNQNLRKGGSGLYHFRDCP